MINNMNSGYNGYSMSNRAVAAYEGGEKPLSKWTKKDLLSSLAEMDIDTSRLNKYSLKTLKKYFLRMSSWHHTGSYVNKTNFYSIKDIENISYETLDRIERDVKEERVEKNNEDYVKAFISYGEWEGSRKHPKLVEKKSYALLKGDWAYIEDGSKKKLSGKHVDVIERYSRAPKGTAAIFKKIKNNKNLLNML